MCCSPACHRSPRGGSFSYLTSKQPLQADKGTPNGVSGERSGSHAQTESGILPKNLTEVAQEGVARNRAVEEDMELQIKELTEKLPKSQVLPCD